MNDTKTKVFPACMATIFLRGMTAFLLAGFVVTSTGCLSPPVAEVFDEEMLPADELFTEANLILEMGRKSWFFRETDYLDAIDVFQEIIDNYPFSDFAIKAELAIAQAYFERKHYEEALSYYRDFLDLHPDDPKVPFTVWMSALCLYNQTHESTKDQDATHQAIAQLEEMMRRFPDAPEAEEAERLWKELRGRLALSEMQIGNFYMDREEYQSAAVRYRGILDSFPGLGFDADALFKLGTCYQKMNLDAQAEETFQIILKHFEGTELAEAAQDAIPAAN